MGLDELSKCSLFVRFVLGVWLVSSVLVVFSLGVIDGIVHGKLYDFGLQFSGDWAVPYWSALGLIYVCLFFPSVLSVIVFIFGFWRWLRRMGKTSASKSETTAVKRAKMGLNSTLVSCNSCGRMFGKPMCVLDSSRGKPTLVNVCPYCGAKLGENGDKRNKDFKVGVIDREREVVRKR